MTYKIESFDFLAMTRSEQEECLANYRIAMMPEEVQVLQKDILGRKPTLADNVSTKSGYAVKGTNPKNSNRSRRFCGRWGC